MGAGRPGSAAGADLRSAMASAGALGEVSIVASDQLRERLGVWIRAGIISPEQADRILALEDPTPSGAGPTSPGPASPGRRALIAEVVGYVGAAFALGAVALLVAEYWSDLAVWARVALAALLVILSVGAGALLHGRAGAAIARLVGVLWALGVAATAWTAGIVAWDVAAIDERWMPTVVGGAAAVVAAVLLIVGRHVLVQLAGFVALGSAMAGTLVALAPLEPGALAFGTLILGGSIAWGLAGAGGWLGPRVSAEATGAVFALIGAQVLTASAWPRTGLSIGIAVALALVALSVPGARVHLLYIGAFGLFVSVPRLVFELFADTLGAPATLLTTGLLLILMAVGLGRIRRSQEVHDA